MENEIQRYCLEHTIQIIVMIKNEQFQHEDKLLMIVDREGERCKII